MALRTSIDKLFLPCVRLILVCLLLFSLYGCLTSGSQAASHSRNQQKSVEVGPKISVFLNLKNASRQKIKMQVISVEILSGDIWVPLAPKPFEIDTDKIGPGQLFVGRATLKEGQYKSIRFNIESASSIGYGSSRSLPLQNPSVEVPFLNEVNLGGHDSKTLIAYLDVEGSFTGSSEFKPAISLAPKTVPFTADLAYVACPLINTIYLIRTDKNWVTGSFGVSGRPTYIGVDQTRNRLYVLAKDEAVIKTIEISSNRMLDRIQIPLTSEPVYMGLSKDKLEAYIVDKRSQYILRMDLSTGSLSNRQRVGEAPSYVIDMPDQNLLALSSENSSEVFLLDPERLTTRNVIPVGHSPAGLLVQDEFLFIAESGSNIITVYNLSTRKVRRRINVGFMPWRLWSVDDKIYVSHKRAKKIVVINSRQFSVSREIPFDGISSEMTSTENRRWLYVGNPDNNGLSIIDTTSNRVAGNLDIGTMPLGLAVVE